MSLRRRPYACCVCDAAAVCVRVFAPLQPDNRRLRLAGRSISCRRNRANFVGLLRCGRSAESSTFDVVYVSFVDVADAQAAAVARRSVNLRPSRLRLVLEPPRRHARTTRCPFIAKFHYTGPTGPARTFLRSGSPRNSVGSVRVSEKVRSGPVGPV